MKAIIVLATRFRLRLSVITGTFTSASGLVQEEWHVTAHIF
jgi:hypothetical protein